MCSTGECQLNIERYDLIKAMNYDLHVYTYLHSKVVTKQSK